MSVFGKICLGVAALGALILIASGIGAHFGVPAAALIFCKIKVGVELTTIAAAPTIMRVAGVGLAGGASGVASVMFHNSAAKAETAAKELGVVRA